MGNPFYYRLRVGWSKAGTPLTERVIPVYAFKPRTSGWDLGPMTLDLLELLTLGADGGRGFTVCTPHPYGYRDLAQRAVSYFELHVKDSRQIPRLAEERRTVATITCRDMAAGDPLAVNDATGKMSCEPIPVSGLVAVNLTLPPAARAPVFTKL